MSEDSDGTRGSSVASPAAKRRVFYQTFRDSWLQDPKYTLWLEKCENIFQARCKVCKKILLAKKSNLDTHNISHLHILNMQDLKEKQGTAGSSNFEMDIKKAEIRYVLDIIDHNKSFYSFDHFTEMSNVALPNCKIIQHTSLKRQKITAIAKNVVNKSIVLKTISILKDKYFSILMDENTDISDVKHICILVRYVEGPNIKTYLLDLICVNTSNAENLFHCLMNCLGKHNLSITNLIGFCANNANVMLGSNNSIMSRLLAVNPEISIFPCINHSFHLVAMHAYESLPEEIDDFLYKVFSYFSGSPKRQKILENKQRAMQRPQLKILEPSSARWLELFACIERILDEWCVLYEVFKDATDNKESKTAISIFKHFECTYIKAYLEFLKLPLELITEFNVIFQSSNVIIHTMLPQCRRLLRHLAQFFIKSNCLNIRNLHELDINKKENLLPLKEIYIGEEAIQTIREVKNRNLAEDNPIIIEFYKNVQNFYKIMFEELVRRIPFNEKFLNALGFLNPETALQIAHSPDPIYEIVDRFPSKFNKIEVAKEWRLLPTHFDIEEVELLKVMNIRDFWYKVSQIKNPAETRYMFPNIAKMAELCLTLPHSNADMERLFSLVTHIKTKHRNNLKSDTVAALVRIKLDFKNKNQNCKNYQISDKMLDLFNYTMYQKEHIPDNLTGILLQETDESGSEESDND